MLNQPNLVIAYGVGLVREEERRQDDPRVFGFFVFVFSAWAASMGPSHERCGKITSGLGDWGGVRGDAVFSFVQGVVAYPSITSMSSVDGYTGLELRKKVCVRDVKTAKTEGKPVNHQ